MHIGIALSMKEPCDATLESGQSSGSQGGPQKTSDGPQDDLKWLKENKEYKENKIKQALN